LVHGQAIEALVLNGKLAKLLVSKHGNKKKKRVR